MLLLTPRKLENERATLSSQLRLQQIGNRLALAHHFGTSAAHQHLCWARTTVVVRTERHSVGASIQDGQQFSFCNLWQLTIPREEIAGFANGTDYIEDATAGILSLRYRNDFVMRFIQRRSEKVVHGGIGDDEAFLAVLLDVCHARE